jgi:hypothetical protein
MKSILFLMALKIRVSESVSGKLLLLDLSEATAKKEVEFQKLFPKGIEAISATAATASKILE